MKLEAVFYFHAAPIYHGRRCVGTLALMRVSDRWHASSGVTFMPTPDALVVTKYDGIPGFVRVA